MDTKNGHLTPVSATGSTPPNSDRLVALIRRRDWEGVRSRLILNPQEAQGRSLNHNLSTPLHLACLHRAPDCVIIMLVQSFPEALMIQDTQGWTPLHVCLLYSTNEETTLFLIRAGGNGAARKNSKLVGAPLHLACRHGCSTRVLRTLLEQTPDLVLTPTASGDIPVDLLIKSDKRRRRHEPPSGDPAVARNDMALVQQLDLFLLALQGRLLTTNTSSNNNSNNNINNDQTQPHLRDRIIFQNECVPTTNYLRLCLDLRQHSNSLQAAVELEDSVTGPLPLHVAACYPVPKQDPTIPNTPVTVSSLFLDPLLELLKANPDIAARSDRTTGRLALHTAIAVGRRAWNDGITRLLEAAPESIVARDPVTALYPFQLAATAATDNNVPVDTTYHLLRTCPHVCAVMEQVPV